MAGLLGKLISIPLNPLSNDHWALVIGNVVQNIIDANLNFVNTIVSHYDYCIDTTVANNAANLDVGSIYDPIGNAFSPPPVNWTQVIEQDLDNIHVALLQCLADAAQASASQVQQAISNATSDSTPTFSPNEQALWNQITNFVSTGG